MSEDRYLVTGGAGFIGSHIVEALVAKGCNVRVVDDLSTGKTENLAAVADRIDFQESDLRDPDAVEEAVAGISIVFHQAALASVPLSVDDPSMSNEVNVTGTLNLLAASSRVGVRRLIYASSSSIYGDTPTLPKVETMIPKPLSPYAVSKLAGEYYCQVFSHLYGLETVSLRYFNVFGPRQDPNSQYSAVIPRFISTYLRGEVPTIHGDGEQTRAFAYVDDVVSANLLAAEAEGISGHVFNVSVHSRVSLNQLDRALREMIGVEGSCIPLYGPPRVGDIKHSYADLSRIQEALEYVPRVTTQAGLEKTIAWYRQRQ